MKHYINIDVITLLKYVHIFMCMQIYFAFIFSSGTNSPALASGQLAQSTWFNFSLTLIFGPL